MRARALGGGSDALPGEPLLGPGEARRLVALYQLDVIDSPAAECFQRVVRLAARVFEVPFARIALVDAVREWALASHGALPGELPIEHSFADAVVRAGEVVAVEDAAASLALFEHPFVVGEPKVRFVAGCPLRSASGAIVGAIYLLGDKPRTLGAAERQVLRDLAGVVDDELAMRANRCFDDSTGLLLRRGLDIVGGQVVSRAARRGEPVSLVVVDIDASPSRRRLRAVGSAGEGTDPVPAAGAGTDLEPAVVLVADVICEVTRASDVPARLPCDELVVLLPDTDESRCAHVARRIADELDRAGSSVGGERFVLRFAGATIDASGEDEEVSLAALLRRAEPLDIDLVGVGNGSPGESRS